MNQKFSHISNVKIKFLNQIQESTNVLESFFCIAPSDWSDIKNALTTPTVGSSEKNKLREKLQQQILEPTKALLKLYNYSLLEGEYYLDNSSNLLAAISKSIENCNKQLEPFYQPVNFSGKRNTILSSTINDIFELFRIIKIFHRYYTLLLERIKSRLQKSNEKIIDFEFEEKLIQYLDDNIRLKKNIDEFIFLVNISLCITDEGYLCNESYLHKLIKISSKFQNEISLPGGIGESNHLNKILIDKVNFLIYKILLRFKKDLKYDIKVSNSTASLSFSSVEFEREYSNPNQVPVFNNFIKLAQKHYNSTSNIIADSFILNNQSEVELIYFTNASYLPGVLPIHQLCKFYKRTLSTGSNEYLKNYISFIDRLIERISELRSICKNSNNLLNYFAYETTLILLVNTKLRLFSKKIISEIYDIESLKLNWILLRDFFEYNHTIFSSNDLHPFQFYKTFSTTITNILERVTNILPTIGNDALNAKDLSLVVNLMLEKYHMANDIFNKCLIKNIDAELMPVYMTMNECFVPYNSGVGSNIKAIEDTLQIFVDSSYILPSNYSYVKSKKEEETLEFNKYYLLCSDLIHSTQEQKIEGLIKSQENIFLEQFKDNEKKIDEKVKDNQFSAFQLIGIYAGLITFVLGGVSIIPKFEKSYTAILLFLFAFSSGLCIFVMLLRIIINKENDYINIGQILFKREKLSTGKTKISFSKYSLFIAFTIIVFSTSFVLICHFHDSKENIKVNTLEVKSNFYYQKDKNNKDSLIKSTIDSFRKTIDSSKTSIDTTYKNQ